MARIEEFLELYAKQSTRGFTGLVLLEFFNFIYREQRKGEKVRKGEMKKYKELRLNKGTRLIVYKGSKGRVVTQPIDKQGD